MPRFSADLGPETMVSFARPAEQGLWRDISLARRIEAALQSREAHFEAAFHSAPTAMAIASCADGRPARFLHVNPALSRLTGYSTSALLDLGFADLAHPEHPAPEEAPASSGPDGAEQPDLRAQRWMHTDGSDIWVRVRTAPLRDSGDQTNQSVCHIEDVTP